MNGMCPTAMTVASSGVSASSARKADPSCSQRHARASAAVCAMPLAFQRGGDLLGGLTGA